MPRDYIISIMTRDRVGIIADVTGVIGGLGGNLAGLSQTVLGGYFTMILHAGFPDGVTAADVRLRLREIDPHDPFEVGVRPCRQERRPRRPAAGNLYVLTAAGPDKMGLVAALCGFLRGKGINIEEFSTRVREDVYWMFLTVRLPRGTEVGRLRGEAQAAMAAAGVRIELMDQRLFLAAGEV